jgi:hypothetical protein
MSVDSEKCYTGYTAIILFSSEIPVVDRTVSPWLGPRKGNPPLLALSAKKKRRLRRSELGIA